MFNHFPLHQRKRHRYAATQRRHASKVAPRFSPSSSTAGNQLRQRHADDRFGRVPNGVEQRTGTEYLRKRRRKSSDCHRPRCRSPGTIFPAQTRVNLISIHVFAQAMLTPLTQSALRPGACRPPSRMRNWQRTNRSADGVDPVLPTSALGRFKLTTARRVLDPSRLARFLISACRHGGPVSRSAAPRLPFMAITLARGRLRAGERSRHLP